jgi:hypothetical protein
VSPKETQARTCPTLCQTVPEAGWAGKQNGDLLRLAEREFDVLLTNDQNIEHQQSFKLFDLAFVVLVAPTNDINDLMPLMPTVIALLTEIRPGELRSVKNPL